MTDTLSLGWSEHDARAKRHRFKALYAVNLIAQSLAALVALFAPAWFAGLLGLDVGAALLPLWAAMVLMASALQLPGWVSPVRRRALVVIFILGRLFMAVVFLAVDGALWPLALFDAAFAVLLALSLQRATIAELQTRP